MATKWAMGTKIQRKNPATAVYEDIIGLGDITGPEQTTDWLDTTDHSSPNSSEEGIPTIHRFGQISAPMHYDPANAVHAALLSDKTSKRLGEWKLIMTNTEASELAFSGYVTGLSYAFPVTGAITQNLTIRITGGMQLTV